MSGGTWIGVFSITLAITVILIGIDYLDTVFRKGRQK